MKLSEKEIQLLEQVKNSGTKLKLMFAIGLPMLTLLLSFIPSKFLPSRKLDLAPNSTVAESLGIPFLLMCIIGAMILLLLLLFVFSNYWKIKKDLKEQIKIEHTAVVKEIIRHRKNEIAVFIEPRYRNKEGFTFEYIEIPQSLLGKKVKITMTKNAMVPLEIIAYNSAENQ